jgi:hypothetical protein
MQGVDLHEAAKSAQYCGTILYNIKPLLDRGLEGATSVKLCYCPCTWT